jgi:ubiquitin-conjugating enzyme E2 D/E
MAMNQKRIVKEFAECSQSPPPGTSVRLVDEADVLKWEILIDGPEQSVYAVRHCLIKGVLHSSY